MSRTEKVPRGSRRIARLRALAGLAVLCAALLGGATPAHASTGSLPVVKATWADTNLGAPDKEGHEHEGQFQVRVQNVGDAPFQAGLTITDKLPAGVTATKITWKNTIFDACETQFGWSFCEKEAGITPASTCSGVGTEAVVCHLTSFDTSFFGLGKAPGLGPYEAGYLPPIYIDLAVPPGASGTGTNTATVEGGGVSQTAKDVEQVPIGETPSFFGLVPGGYMADVFTAEYPFGEPARQAGSHPFEQRVNFGLNERLARTDTPPPFPYPAKVEEPAALVRDVEVTLPRGEIFNPEATPKCDPTAFAEEGADGNGTGCPPDTQVGYLTVGLAERFDTQGNIPHGPVAIYNLKPPKGKVSDFAFEVAGYVQGHIYGELDPSRDYALKAVVPDISAFYFAVTFSETTFWGVPGDPVHDRFRFYTKEQANGDVTGAPYGTTIRPLITNPMDCGVENGGMRIRVDSYSKPGEWTKVEEAAPDNVTGCEDRRFRFEPDVSLEPTDRHAGAPTGLEVKLKVPQRNDEVKNAEELYAENGSVKAIATPPIKKTVVTLPEGMTLNPSAGQGLTGCSLEQLGMSASGVPNGEPVRCPASAQIGTLIMHSPDLPENEPLTGKAYIAKQGENPFGSLFALYLVLENPERGLLVKLAGRIELDPLTGKITTTFDNLPQFPVSDFQLSFKSGPRAALVNPSTCGRKTITAEYFSWQDPNTPHVATDSYEVTQNPDGSRCVYSTAEWPFNPQFTAGTVNPAGGAFSPFTLRLTRGDSEQQLSALSVTLPPGLLGKLAGVAECPDANIAAAMALDHAGRGAGELANPPCPAASQIGSSLVSAGTGPSLSYVPGKVYLAGPYRGAPFSVVVITPSVVGPYDLGVVTVRSALFIDPRTAQGRVVTDQLPQILDGIPVRIRDLRVDIDRPGFMFNPTNCAEEQIAGSASSFEGATAALTQRFQAANCATLGFKPRFTASTSGRTSRKNGASLDVKLTYPKGSMGSQADVRSVKVRLPKQLPSRLATLQKACPAATFAEDPAACPAASRVGGARVITPVLPVPLEGPAYFVSHGGEEFPNLIMVLQGDGVTVELVGDTFIQNGVTTSTFRSTPDVPFESFELTLPQGPYSALAANGDLCRQKLVMPTAFTAQNGLQLKQSTRIKVTGCGRHKARKRAKRRQHKKK